MHSTAARVQEVSVTNFKNNFIFELGVVFRLTLPSSFCRKQFTTFHAVIYSIACLKLDQLLGFCESKITLLCFNFRGSFENTHLLKKIMVI